jgi:hypothetical protein
MDSMYSTGEMPEVSAPATISALRLFTLPRGLPAPARLPPLVTRQPSVALLCTGYGAAPKSEGETFYGWYWPGCGWPQKAPMDHQIAKAFLKAMGGQKCPHVRFGSAARHRDDAAGALRKARALLELCHSGGEDGVRHRISSD